MTVKVIRGSTREWRPYRFPPRCSGALQEQWQGGDPAELQRAVADGYQQGSEKGYHEGLEQGREAGHAEGLRSARAYAYARTRSSLCAPRAQRRHRHHAPRST